MSPGDALAATQAPAQRCVPGSMWRQSRAGSPGSQGFEKVSCFFQELCQIERFCNASLEFLDGDDLMFFIPGREHAFGVQLFFSGAKGKVQ